MHGELIGQSASLSLPCDIDATGLLVGFVNELMEADGSEASEPDKLEQDIEAAIGSLCREGGAGGNLLASFAILEDAVEIRLRRDDDASGAAAGEGEAVVTARAS